MVLGEGSPQAFSAQMGFLLGLEFACSPCVHKGFPPLRTPTENMQKNRTLSCPSLTKTDGSLDLVPGRLKRLPTAPGVLEEGQSRMGKMQRKISLRPCVSLCVCVLCRHLKCTCVAVCRLCHNKLTLSLTFYICGNLDFTLKIVCVSSYYYH